MDQINFCKICFKPIRITNMHEIFRKDITLCYECFSKFDIIFKKIKARKYYGFIIYNENDFLNKLYYLYTKCDDFELKSIFLCYCFEILRIKYKGYKIRYVEDEKSETNSIKNMYECLNLKEAIGSLQNKNVLLVFGIIENTKHIDAYLDDLEKERPKNISFLVLSTKT